MGYLAVVLNQVRNADDKLQATIAGLKFKELKEYAKEISKAKGDPDGAAEAKVGVREEGTKVP